MKKIYVNNLDHPHIAACYNNIGNVYINRGKYDLAIEFYNKAIQIQQKCYESSPHHQEIEDSHYNLERAQNFQLFENRIISVFKCLKKMKDENNDSNFKISSLNIKNNFIEGYCKTVFCNNFSAIKTCDNEVYITLTRDHRQILRDKISSLEPLNNSEQEQKLFDNEFNFNIDTVSLEDTITDINCLGNSST